MPHFAVKLQALKEMPGADILLAKYKPSWLTLV
jgi:hypothetical protein